MGPGPVFPAPRLAYKPAVSQVVDSDKKNSIFLILDYESLMRCGT